ncbi:DUF397 domain-containing protein [Streptomyces sp. APSN-46.1]|uniref:DUF397 domain-containing protein n=1 Tax=Streptomyces sp. APSN-46.1 TaxID=2929049 RepID=UPI001FB1C902|nr:DUF397 domain-containing protein [Streptomyces sp. APSN-46.1]MCJ1678369.1 DUF397 domain-containing protein [Streptomyces sp. APSN-46.1]
MSPALRWFKSSYSNSEGGACVEVALGWRKSSYSDAEGDNCVEVAACPVAVHVRDSKVVAGPELVFTGAPWAAFLSSEL